MSGLGSGIPLRLTQRLTSRGASLQALHQSLQQPRARLDRREQQVLVVGVGGITVDAEPVERRDAHLDSEIAVRAAADDRRTFEREADLPRNGGGSLKDEINPPIAREGWARDLAGYRYFDIWARRLEGQDLRLHLACACAVTEAQVDLDRTILGDSIPGGAAIDQANIGRDTPRAIVQTLDRKRDLRHGEHRVAPLVGVPAGMCRPPVRADDESTDAFARGHDLAAVARRLGDEDVAMPRRLPFDDVARGQAAQFFVRREQECNWQRGAPARLRNPAECCDREHQPALHVIDARSINSVVLASI